MSEILKKIANFLEIEEEKTGEISSLPKPKPAVKGIASVPNHERNVPIKPIGSSRVADEEWKKSQESTQARIDMDRKQAYLKPKDKPVRPLEVSDWRRQK